MHAGKSLQVNGTSIRLMRLSYRIFNKYSKHCNINLIADLADQTSPAVMHVSIIDIDTCIQGTAGEAADIHLQTQAN